MTLLLLAENQTFPCKIATSPTVIESLVSSIEAFFSFLTDFLRTAMLLVRKCLSLFTSVNWMPSLGASIRTCGDEQEGMAGSWATCSKNDERSDIQEFEKTQATDTKDKN